MEEFVILEGLSWHLLGGTEGDRKATVRMAKLLAEIGTVNHLNTELQC
jgi:hypothetical protein